MKTGKILEVISESEYIIDLGRKDGVLRGTEFKIEIICEIYAVDVYDRISFCRTAKTPMFEKYQEFLKLFYPSLAQIMCKRIKYKNVKIGQIIIQEENLYRV